MVQGGSSPPCTAEVVATGLLPGAVHFFLPDLLEHLPCTHPNSLSRLKELDSPGEAAERSL